MSLQKAVNLYPAVAIAGMPASVDEAHYTAVTLKSEKPVNVGQFVFFSADKANTHVTQTAGGQPVRGLVHWVRTYAGELKGSMVAPAGSDLTIATEGNFWVKCDNPSTAPKVGDKVFAMDTDGSIQTSTTTVTSAQATNFVVTYVESPSDSKSMIIISNLTASGK